MAFVSFRRYEVDPANVSKIVQLVQDGFVPILKSSPGFIAYRALDAGDGVIASISVFEDQAGVEQSDSKAASWVKENLAGLITTPPNITAGNVVVSETAD